MNKAMLKMVGLALAALFAAGPVLAQKKKEAKK